MATKVHAPPIPPSTHIQLRTRSPLHETAPTAANQPPDPLLLAASVAGDQLAFHELMERHQAGVYATCHHYLGDGCDAEDATQNTFIALARHAATLRGTAKLSPWLHRVAINACHDIARRRARHPPPARQELPDVAELDQVAYRETEIDVYAALAHLDAISRAALILVAIEDHTYAEAAEIVGMSVPAIKSRIHRARARLADILSEAA